MSDEKKPLNSQSTFETQLRALKERRFHPGNKIEVPVPILRLKHVPICTAGNISNIQGAAKSAKSSVMGAAIAAVLRNLLGKPESLAETLGFSSLLPANGEKVCKHILHFDTEQSPYHHHKLCMDVMARASVTHEEYDKIPFHSYSLVATDHPLRRKMIEQLVAEFQGEEQSLACLFLDGVADIISDPNNAEESFDVVDWLHRLSAKHQCAVITILHENPGDAGKARGHLGSQIIRKSETNLRVRKGSKRDKGRSGKGDDHVSLIWVERARGASISESEGVQISWCRDQKRHTIHDPAKHVKPTDQKPTPEAPRSAALTIEQQRIKDWLETTALKHPKKNKELIELIVARGISKKRTGHTKIKEWARLGWIHKTGPGQAPYALGPLPPEPPEAESPPSPKPAKSKQPKGSRKVPKKIQEAPRKKESKAAAKNPRKRPVSRTKS